MLISPSSSSECTNGFMEYDLLKEKASQISNDNGGKGKLSFNILYGGSVYLMPSLSFHCPGNITGFYLGVDVRIDNGRSDYPWVGLFESYYGSGYKLLAGSKRDITLNADDFSTNGLFEYELEQPINFEANQMLGVYQPLPNKRIVTLFYHALAGQHIYELYLHSNGVYYKKSWDYPQHRWDSRLLLYPVTSKF